LEQKLKFNSKELTILIILELALQELNTYNPMHPPLENLQRIGLSEIMERKGVIIKKLKAFLIL